MRSGWIFQKRRWMFLAPIVFVLFIAAGGALVQQLWNWLLPEVFGGRQITFWQALGILILSRILFGGFRGHGFARSNMRRRMAERWEQMTPEERERFRQGMGRCGGAVPPPGGSVADSARNS
jgi:hypothetical protein